jgi:hypothetical protein
LSSNQATPVTVEYRVPCEEICRGASFLRLGNFQQVIVGE